MTDWYIKLFGHEDVTGGKLEHKVKSLLKTLPSTQLLDSNIMWSSLPDELLQLGLTRQILLDRSLSFVQSDVIITNNVMSALEAFRVIES
ncbi:hypothetical protein RRG08_042157 [Elysia crispata]|uniref:Uncharacterized protein n=1 Tax=Elysia crispata TaxID=231223 RepID=A0AAE1DAK4_9GAST|nr:hypothetical protein RRG08_042157 [Elysia crispata]